MDLSRRKYARFLYSCVYGYKLHSDRELQRTFGITLTKLMELIGNCYKIRAFFDVPSRYV
jgi:hypothetical protein